MSVISFHSYVKTVKQVCVENTILYLFNFSYNRFRETKLPILLIINTQMPNAIQICVLVTVTNSFLLIIYILLETTWYAYQNVLLVKQVFSVTQTVVLTWKLSPFFSPTTPKRSTLTDFIFSLIFLVVSWVTENSAL